MKITICGSMTFAKEMIEVKEKLSSLSYRAIIPDNTEKFLGKIPIEKKWEKIELDVFKQYFEKIKNSDAILVLNITKDNIENYIGANALIEMAFAYVLDKKIFLLNPVPKLSYTDEIIAMQPLILNGDLTKIK